jgi:hypothetical protein
MFDRRVHVQVLDQLGSKRFRIILEYNEASAV